MAVTVGPGVYIPAFGPPLAYDPTSNPKSGGKYGGTPDITPFLQGPAKPALPQENGWKDTVTMYPGQVTRILVRWAPTDTPANTAPANANFTFDPNGGHGYVWHCHIVDHEDNEMMRPDAVVPIGETIGGVNNGITKPNRIFVKGTDY